MRRRHFRLQRGSNTAGGPPLWREGKTGREYDVNSIYILTHWNYDSCRKEHHGRVIKCSHGEIRRGLGDWFNVGTRRGMCAARGNDQTLEPWLARLTESCRHVPQSSCVTLSGSHYGCVLEETSWSSPPTVVKARRSLQRWCSRV